MIEECKSIETNHATAIALKNVSKSYKHFTLRDASFEVQAGTVAGLIGPNGAGKSTAMRLMMGLVHPDRGDVRLLGQSISSDQASARNDVGYFSEDMRLYKRESIAWHMQFIRSIFPSWDDHYASQLVERFGLVPEQKIKGLSHGQRVKSILLLILPRRPKLLILDEPTTGLDPVARQEIIGELMRAVEDETRTILFSSHNTQDVEKICDTITFIDRGRVIASQNRDDFLDQWRRIRLHVPADWKIPTECIASIESSHRNQCTLTLDRFNPQMTSTLESSGANVEAIERMTLEEIFVTSVMRGRGTNS